MARISVRPAAVEDLVEIAAYYEAESTATADKFLTEAESAFEYLSQHPRMGRLWRTSTSDLMGIRVWPVRRFKHLIFYFPLEEGVEVVRVIHGMRDIDDLLIGKGPQ